MRALIVFSCFLSYFIDLGFADKDAIGYELLTFYYAYKTEAAAQGPRTIGDSCRSKTPVCYWDEFIKDVMGPRFTSSYKAPTLDHTLNPSDSAGHLNEINRAITNDKAPAQYKIAALINDSPNGRSNAQVLDVILQRGEQASRAKGKDKDGKTIYTTSIDDLKAMRENGRAVISARYNSGKGLFEAALNKWVGDAARGFIVRDDDGFPNWRKTLKAISDAQAQGKISRDTSGKYRNEIRSFARNFRVEAATNETQKSHLAIIQVVQDRVTRMDKQVVKRDGGPLTSGC